jgi:hypothetical protein
MIPAFTLLLVFMAALLSFQFSGLASVSSAL